MTPESAADDSAKAGMEKRGFMASMMPLRQRFAKGIRQLAEVTADHLSKCALSLLPTCYHEKAAFLVY